MSRRFGRRQKREMAAKIKALETLCSNLKASNDAFIKELRDRRKREIEREDNER